MNEMLLLFVSPVSGVVTLVGCELLCGLHRVTSSINAHYPPPLPGLDAPCSARAPPEDAAAADHSTESEPKGLEAKSQPTSLFTRTNAQSSGEILRKYLLGGVAWRCLALLKALGVEGLSCCRQLSSVLVWVFGELTAAPSPEPASPRRPPAHHAAARSRTPIHQLFSNKIWSKQKPVGHTGPKIHSTHSSEKGSSIGRSRQSKADSVEKSKRKSIKESEPSSESGDSNDDLQVLNRSLTIKVCTPNDDFDYFTSPLRSSNEYPNESYYGDPYYTPRKTKPKADDYMNDKHKEIINTEISSFEFILMITDLLQELCKAESSLSGSEGSQISVQCINFSLRNLCSLQFSSGSGATSSHNAQEVSKIKVALTELLIVSLDKVLIHSDLCAKLINNGILPMLLRLLEDVICKCSTKYQTKTDSHNRAKEIEAPNRIEANNLLKFVFGIAYSIMAFFHCLLMQCRNVDKLREFTDQFKLYSECLKGGLLKDCIELMIRIPGVDEDEAVVLIKKLIESVGRLVGGMKRVRSEVIHTAACPRARHKMCRQRVAAGMHHHHDILGEASVGLPISSACCVSVLYGTLTSLVTDEEVAAHSVLRHKILKVMLNCGVCCCFSPGALMESIVRLMLTHHTVATLCLQLLEYTVYGELGASVLIPKVTDQLPCSICEPCDDDRRETVRKYCPHGVSPIERKSVWSFLIHYNSLLQLDNHNNVLHATVSHLLRVTPKCRTEMKYELLFSVIYPTFIVAKHRYMIRLEESAYFLTVSCLNIFASLLNTVSFAEQFIQKGGLSYVLELVSMTEFSNQCCSILEIAIIVEIFKLMKENSDMAYYREIGSLASVQMLFKSLAEMTDKFYKIYKLKLAEDKFEELRDVTKEREMLAFTPASRGEGQGRRMSSPKAIKTPFSSEAMVEESIEDYVEVLKTIWTFWKTCAGLCLCSPTFRLFVSSEAALLDSFALLKLALHQLCARDCGAAECRVLIKLLEALLTVQFAVSDVTSGRSKRTSCSIVRCALASPGALVQEGCAGAGGGGLRALCEALVRVATQHISPHHTQPRHHHAKVPPLLCPSGGSSAECSSSEESVSAPYASEHSDAVAARPDEGYEADVEIGNLDIVAEKARKLSSSLPLSDSSFVSGMVGGLGEQAALAECGEYARGGELSHPELCVIVVDILTQIVTKVMSGLEENSIPAEELARAASVGAGVARACAARLCCSGRAPVPLLRRLLAPPAAALLTQPPRPPLHELQRSILELIHVLASQSIEPSELSAFLALFLSDDPPLGTLLGALQRLVEAAEHDTPDCILTFPIARDQEPVVPLTEVASASLNGASAQSYHAEALAKRLCEAHIRAGIRSAWSACAARCGVEGAGWAPWAAGFALQLWLRSHPHTAPRPPASHNHSNWDDVDEWQEESAESEASPRKPPQHCATQLAHLLSIGNDSLLFETWLDTHTGALVLRLTRPESSSATAVHEARLEACVPPRRWTHLALNVAERVHKRRIHIQVTVFVNGYEMETVSMPLPGILVRKVTPTNLLIGWARSTPAANGTANGGIGPANGGIGTSSGCAGAYHVSSASVYRAPLFSAYTALHMAAHGPDHECYVRCESPNFPPVLTPNVLDSNIDWDQVFEMSGNVLRELHDNLLLTFSAHAPNIVTLYHQTTLAMPTVFGSRSAGSMLGGGGAGSSAGGVPEGVAVRWAGAALPSRHRGLAPALYTLGGPEIPLYLFARVVELDGSAEEQAAALRILLQVCRVDNRLYAALFATSALDMLLVVLASPKCHADHHLLRVILEEACSGPVLSSSASGVLSVQRSPAALLEPVLLVLVMRAWKHFDKTQDAVWEVEGSGTKEQGSAWALSLACCVSLLRPTHPRRRFNHYQFARVDLLRHLLVACKERFLNSECLPLSAATSNNLVELVRGLVGSPPLLHHIALLTDFLLLMHQASDTFVTHSRANFYFLLTPETQEMSEFSASSLKRKPSRRRKHEPRPSISSVSTEDGANDNLSMLNEMAHNPDTDAEKTDPDSSVESTKQMKGIINMQIKESQKLTDASSTSENSDPPPPVEEDGDSVRFIGLECASRVSVRGTSAVAVAERARADADLTEYIVVDVDDVSHTTVDLYTGGIYHQRRLRAGAEPGWTACEGLLLLLRDTIAVLSEHQLTQALCGAVSAESLIVLANHRSGSVRAALVRVLAALQRRDPPELARKLRQHQYLLHLANQISLYEGTWELAAACAALLTKCDVPLEDQLDEDIWVEAREEWTWRCPPLLALLPCCLRQVPLAHNITRLLARIIDMSSLRALGEVCVTEVVVRSIRGAGQLPEQLEGRALLLHDLHQLLIAVALKALATHHGMQTICDIHYQLTFVEQTSNEEAVRVACRSAQVALLNAQLDRLEERLGDSSAPHNKYANYFTTVLSSAMSVGSEGGRVDRAELASRHLATVTRALNFLLTHSPHEPLPPGHAALYDRILATLLLAVSGSSSGSRPRWWSGGGAEWAALLQEAVWWGGAAADGARQLQPRLLRRLYRAHPHALALLTPQDPSVNRKLAVYLLSILQYQHLQAEAGSPCVELAITDWARGWAVSTQAALPSRLASDSLAAEGAALLARDLARWAAAHKRLQPALVRAVFRKEALCGRLAEGAMSITRQVVEAQNGERKAFMQHLRRQHAARNRAATRWQRLVLDHTHDKGVWHEPRSYPASWQLDPTEGPGRVRVRLRRAHLRIHKRFLQPEQQHKPDLARRPAPLRSVLGRSASERDGLAASLQLNECVAYMARVTHVTVDSEARGELLLTDRSIHFVPEDTSEDDEPPETSQSGHAQCWSLSSVVQVATRRWCLQERALELFLSSGHAQLLAFDTDTERGAFLKALKNCHLPNKMDEDTLSEAMSQWRNGTITNWEYLMRLNGLGGRSYNDLMQYPVLPFVLADYTSRVLDLTAPETFRDLTRPMAVQHKSREQHYINTYNDLKAARREGCSPVVARQPHHYASLYSNSGGVLHYLVRLPPFTELFLNYQDNNFDMPDRTFHSLATTWRLITNDSPTDVKELIPELFYLPELFHNNEGLELGVRQCGLGVDEVEVPPWAAESRAFVLLHRQALESPLVTDRLPHWVDLVFGYKQTGQAAIDALNVFPACTYYGFDPMSLEDEVDRTAAAAMVRTYGQAPRQLLRQPHPHAAHDLTTRAPHRQLEAWGGAIGIRWGRYCGSPDLPDATVVARRACAAATVHALANPRLVAALPRTTALVALPSDTPTSGGKDNNGNGSWGVLSWGHWDNIVRLKLRRDAPPELLVQVPPLDQITLVTSSCGPAYPVIVGYASGRVEAWRVSTAGRAQPRLHARAMPAHRAPLAAAAVCAPAATIATADTHGTILLWDLDELLYIRTLPNRDMLPVTHLAISPTLSDVASVHETCPRAPAADAADAAGSRRAQAGDADSYERDASDKYQSLVRVHTVNGRFVGSVRVSERVTCVCYSGAAEGASVNVVAAGLRGGGVALYSSWDLRPVARFPPAHANPERPTGLTSLTYSSDSMVLFGCYADGAVVAWESGAGSARAAPRVLPAHALL
ncbi:hypothetical protein ABMA27_001801 [Loxostege sticticalis]|uniref:Lysosomal-trafficking regulator n=1 Tax=Loxostege sticticalis TaxID=481309 RepID=A0ABR3HVI7_LOXSC